MEAERHASLTLAALDAAPLRAADDARVAAWLRAALETLEARIEDDAWLAGLGSPLSRPVLSDALRTTLAVRDELEAAQAALAGAEPRGRVAMILAANVETAVLRPLVWALLARDAVALRVSSRRAGLAPALHEALSRADPELAGAVAVLRSERDDLETASAIDDWAEVIHVHGSDATVRAVSARSRRPVVGHGHGLGLAVLTSSALDRLGTGARAESAFRALALDVARYDQRGCLSPQLVLVEPSAPWPTSEVAAALHAPLSELDATFPRGALDEHERLAARLWRDVALALGVPLLEGSGHAVSVEGGELRSGPGARSVAVHEVSSGRLDGLLAALAPHLKCVGVPDEEAMLELEGRLDATSPRPTVVPLGRMQTPSLLAPADGRPPWHGLAADRD
jgi:hypothetical protein